VVEVIERLDATGKILVPLDAAPLEAAARQLVARGVTSAAVALLHSYHHPDHERRVRDILHRAGFTHVSCSSDLAPFIKILPRTQTAVVNAYLAPVVEGYVARVAGALPDVLTSPPVPLSCKQDEGVPDTDGSAAPREAGEAPAPGTPSSCLQERGTGGEVRALDMGNATVHVMTSAGGLVRADGFRAKDSLLSGPAGGIVGAARAGKQAGFSRLIAFDMGGTSTDVARYDDDFRLCLRAHSRRRDAGGARARH
jgi:5-oxoprolinase (ATP-hydrolysing)